ncbi:hypothetical protein ABW19_dt0201601 [Dactylella cylindrospora]|nr:hypothetical protein ABW19_dt0201601 [Dactylella cylindrospora]
MDLTASLERTLQGKVKPMITQCCIRYLYATNNQPLIALAKTFERRRCNHSIDSPALPPLECLLSVVIPSKESPIPNKHRYVVATDDPKIREEFRGYPGVPGIHIMRSVMVLDQVSDSTLQWRDREERGKLRSGLKDKPQSKKRKRTDDSDEEQEGEGEGSSGPDELTPKAAESNAVGGITKKKKNYGKKQPNPLSVMKKKKASLHKNSKHTAPTGKPSREPGNQTADSGYSALPKAKRKRKRTHGNGAATQAPSTEAPESMEVPDQN